MAFIQTAKIVGFIKRNAIPIFLGYGFYKKFSHMRECDQAYKFVYSTNDLERKLHLKSLEELVESKI